MRDDHPTEPPPGGPGGADDGAAPFTFSIALLADPDADPDGHQREWTRVHQHYTARLNGYWHGRIPDDAERRLFIQDVWVKTLPNVRKLRAPAVMWKWLQTVSERHFIDRRRSATVSVRQLARLEARELIPDAEVSEEVDALEWLAHDPFDGWPEVDPATFRERIMLLSEPDRALLTLIGEGHEHAEVARRLGIASADACRQRLRRIRRQVTGT